MHYIRLLRPPALAAARQTASLSLVLTITTDLGESFLCPDEPVAVSVVLETETETETEPAQNADGRTEPDASEAGNKAGEGDVPLEKQPEKHVLALTTPARNRRGKAGKAGDASWRSGMRVLKMDIPLSREATACLLDDLSMVRKRRRIICISVADSALSAATAQQIVAGDRGLIVPLWIEVPTVGDEFPHVAMRRLCVDPASQPPVYVEVEENIGESIARHIWDAGLVTVAFLADICMKGSHSHNHSHNQRQHKGGDHLEHALRDLLARHNSQLHALELGSGVGILGIGLAAILGSLHGGGGRHRHRFEHTILLTDLAEAEERAVANMARLGCPSGAHTVEHDHDHAHEEHTNAIARPHVRLDYENLDWEDGCRGRFGHRVADGRPWDLVMLSDCTYNVDMLPALVQTLSALHAASASASALSPAGTPLRVLLARKPRHASEEALFDLLPQEGWQLQAKSIVPLPFLGGESEAVELYLYSKQP